MCSGWDWGQRCLRSTGRGPACPCQEQKLPVDVTGPCPQPSPSSPPSVTTLIGQPESSQPQCCGAGSRSRSREHSWLFLFQMFFGGGGAPLIWSRLMNKVFCSDLWPLRGEKGKSAPRFTPPAHEERVWAGPTALFQVQGTACGQSRGRCTWWGGRERPGAGTLWAAAPPSMRPPLSARPPPWGRGPLGSNTRLPINHSRMSSLPAPSITLISCLLVFKSC